MKKERKEIKAKTKKVIAVKSGGFCYKEGERLEKEETIIGEFAHIESDSPIGPRANPENPRDNTAKNLILVTNNNHKIIDEQVEKYPTADLQKIKKEHEEKIREKQFKAKEKLKNKSFF
ncbi:MAG: hypothetical protein RR904_05555 [Bacilli bacterium]